MTIYLDAVWLLNFLFDMMLLMLTGALARERIKRKRLFLGAFIAALLVPITLFYPNTFFSSVIGKLIFSLGIIVSTFRFRSAYQTLKLLVLFYFITFAIGGGLIGIHYFLNQPMMMSANGVLTFNGGFGQPVTWMFVVIFYPFVWKFTKNRMDKHAIEKIRYEQMYDLSLQIRGKQFHTSGLMDSGNQLVDPITKKAVIICDELFLQQWFSKNEWHQLKEAHDELALDTIPEGWDTHIHIIPYHSVEGRSRFMLAIKPEKLIIYMNEEEIIVTNVLVGIQFSHLTKDQNYHCLLQPQIMKLAAVYTA